MPKKTPKKQRAPKGKRVRRSAQEVRRARLARRRALVSILILLVVAAIVFFLVLRNSSEISIAENGIGSLVSRAQSGLTGAAEHVRQFFERWRNYDKLEADYEALMIENQQLSLQLASSDEAVQENERLKNALDATSRYEALDPIFARVIAREPGQWFETFSINRGKNDGVNAGMSVVNGDGLIGRVYEAGMNYAKVICIIDSRSAVACMVQSTRDNGIMRGRVAATSSDAQCYVYYLPNLNSIMPGDVVITSGTDSLFPKGLHIGTVTAVSMDAGSEGSYAVVNPSVDFKHIEEVFVLREVIETDSDEILPSVTAATRAADPNATPGPDATPTPSPTPEEETWSYPSADATVEILESLPEDEWVREQ